METNAIRYIQVSRLVSIYLWHAGRRFKAERLVYQFNFPVDADSEFIGLKISQNEIYPLQGYKNGGSAISFDSEMRK